MTDTAPSPWLLVPMEVSALVVGKGANAHSWSEVVPDFGRIHNNRTILGAELIDLFPDSSPPLEEGIHLHWWLPDAFGRALRDQDGKDIYPHIPNRWLVRRVRHSPGAFQPRDSESWIIESDFLSPVEPSKGAPEKTRAVTILWDSPTLCARVGRVWSLKDWVEDKTRVVEESKYRFPLTAFGAGTPEFAAHYPACRSVLGFHDERPSVDDCDVSYLVIGWCSDRKQDLLHDIASEAEWDNRLELLQWSSSARLTGPRVLCHGAVTRVRWKPGQEHQSAVPNDAATVCIGNTGAEALATLLADKTHPNDRDRRTKVERLLTAFQYDMLGRDRLPDDLQGDLHRHRFSSHAGGTCYAITAKAKTPVPATDVKGAETAPPVRSLPADVEALLRAVNAVARNLAQHERDLMFRQQELFTHWAVWAKQYTNQRAEPVQFSPRLSTALEQFKSVQGERERLRGVFETNHQNLTKILTDRLPELELSELAEPPFHRPADPAVLVCGEGMAPSGGTSFDRDSGKLTCRVSTEIVTGVWLTLKGFKSERPATAIFPLDASSALPASTGTSPPPDLLQDLLYELLLVDSVVDRDPDGFPSMSPAAIGQRLTGVSSAQGGLILGHGVQRLPSDQSGVVGPPDHIDISKSLTSLGFTRWQRNPWRPVLLKWEVEWCPDPQYLKPAAANSRQVYSGYSLLAPHAKMVLRHGLEAIEKGAEGEKGKQVKEKLSHIIPLLDGLPVLGQVLDGLHDAFRQLRHGLQLQPINPAFLFDVSVKAPLDEVTAEAPGWDWQHTHAPDPSADFLPIRAGHLKIRRLHLVDSFGQARKLIDEGKPLKCRLLRSFGFPESDERDDRVPLPLRYVQPARLDLRWRRGDEGCDDNSPLCGWIVPNHLDKSLMICDASGKLLGCLQHLLRTWKEAGTGSSKGADKNAFFWVPVPGWEKTNQGIVDPDLQAFIDFLRNLPADAGDILLDSFKEALEHTGRHVEVEPRLSILIGRPLALARASLQIELMGPAIVRIPSAEKPDASPDTSGFDRIRFPVRLGIPTSHGEGLVGYFLGGYLSGGRLLDGEHGILNLRQGLTSESPPSIRSGQELRLDAIQVAHLTLLFDPSAPVHAHCSLLPNISLELPNDLAAKASSIRDVFFQSAPVVGPSGQPRLPRPADDYGQWSWAVRPDVTYWKEYPEISEPVGGITLGQPPAELQEGWLKLVMNPVQIVAFWVKEGSTLVAAGTTITLGWQVQGAEELTLSSEGGSCPLGSWSREATGIPVEHRVLIKKGGPIELTASDGKGNRSTKVIEIKVR